MNTTTGFALELRFDHYTSTTVGKFHRTALVDNKVHVQYGGLRYSTDESTNVYSGTVHKNTFATPVEAAKKAVSLVVSKIKKGYYPVSNLRVTPITFNGWADSYDAMRAFDTHPDEDIENVIAAIQESVDPAVQPYVLALALNGQNLSTDGLMSLSNHESKIVQKAVSTRLVTAALI